VLANVDFEGLVLNFWKDINNLVSGLYIVGHPLWRTSLEFLD
jgi:hypothetical protein